MSIAPSTKELKKLFWKEEKKAQKLVCPKNKHEKIDKKAVIKKYTKKLYKVWRDEYTYPSKKALNYLLGR